MANELSGAHRFVSMLNPSHTLDGGKALSPGLTVRLWKLSATQVAGQVEDQADQQDEPKPASADERSPKVKTTAAEQQQQHQENHDNIHATTVSFPENAANGVFTP